MKSTDEDCRESSSTVSCLRRLQLKQVCLLLSASTFMIVFMMICHPTEQTIVEGYIITGKGIAPDERQVNSTNLTRIQEHRQQLVASVCRQHQPLRLLQRFWTYKMDRRHGLVYCPIPKAGWSSWKRLLFYINGAINSTDVEIGITSDSKAGVVDLGLPAVQRTKLTQQQFLFAFVRDPWRRLVSAYINKAVDWNYTRILHTPCKWETMEPYNEPITFSQFLTCIAEAGSNVIGMDMHWTPMWQLCNFCHLHYDYIGHMETIEEDAAYIIKRNGLNVTFPKIFSSKAHRADEVIEYWYASVPLSVIQRLRELYKYDFLLHGYSDIPPGWNGKLS